MAISNFACFGTDYSANAVTLGSPPATAANGQGGTAERSGMPHTGRIRIYGDHSTTKMAARSW